MNDTTRIMIVEDEVLVAEDIKETLHDFGYHVIATVEAGEDAIQYARRDKPDLVLMDIVLKGQMDGISAAKIISNECGIPVVFLTAYSEKATLERAKLSEPYGYITKPYEEKDLRNAITIALYRKNLDNSLEEYRRQLEKEVETQTKNLEKANSSLSKKVEKLTEVSIILEEKTQQLKDANTTLHYLLNQRDQDKIDLSERITSNINDLVLPHLTALGNSKLTIAQQDYIDLIRSNIQEILKPFAHHLTSKHFGLSHMELRVADLVKNGKRNKEIAEYLCIAPKTVEFHRENIRRKLGINNKKINLRTLLKTL